MQGRSLPDWINGFLKYAENSESPRSYLKWSAFSAISAALQRKCFLVWDKQIFPNNYIVLVGPSGRTRKSDGIRLARSLVEGLSIPILGDQSTTEAIIQTMAKGQTSPVGSKLVFHSSMSCFVEELSLFINEKMNNSTHFTTWYDCNKTWEYGTKHQGVDIINNVYVNMLAATTPSAIPDTFPLKAIRGGLASRCIFIVEERKFQSVADPTENRPDKQLMAQLLKDLERIQSMAGEFRFDDAAKLQYKQWYNKEEEKIRSGMQDLSDENFDGYNSRRATHLMKVSMIMSASRGGDFTINAKDFRRALTALETAEKNMPKAFAGIGENKLAAIQARVQNYIQERGTTTRSEILRHFQRSVDEYGFAGIIKMLSDMKVIKVTIGAGESEYKWIGPRPSLTLIRGDKED